MRVTFYIGKHHKDFKKRIEKEIYAMNLLMVDYIIFERTDKLLPVMDIDGCRVAGLDVIQETLYSELQNEFTKKLVIN